MLLALRSLFEAIGPPPPPLPGPFISVPRVAVIVRSAGWFEMDLGGGIIKAQNPDALRLTAKNAGCSRVLIVE